MKFIKMMISVLLLVVLVVGGYLIYQQKSLTLLDENATSPATTVTTSTAPREPVTVPEATFQVDEISVTFTSNGHRLVGELYKPQSLGESPLAIYAHELGMDRNAGRKYARFLAERGVATVIFDFAGGSPSSESEGTTDEMTLSSEVEDLESVILQSQSIDGIDASRVHIIGASQGGLVAALLAARYPSQVRSLTLLYPAFLIPEVVRQLAEVMGDRSLVTNLFSVYPIGKNYVNDLWDLDVYQVIGLYQGPVMMIHGSQDPLIDISYLQKALDVYPHGDLHVIEGAGHSFTDEYFEEASRYLWTNIATAP